MKNKTLIKKFAYNELVQECDKQGWRLPTLEEARVIDTPSDCFYIQPSLHVYDERLTYVYYPNSNSIGLMNKSFKLVTVVVVEDKFCVNCNHCDDLSYYCDILELYVDVDLNVNVEKWGCTEFKRRVK